MSFLKNTVQRFYAARGLRLILVAAVLLQSIALIQYFYLKNALLEEATLRAENKLSINRLEIEKVTTSVEAAANSTAWTLEERLDHPEEFMDVFRKMLEANPVIIDGSIGFIPGYYPEQGHWYEPLLARRTNDTFEELILGSDSHDYFRAEWYTVPLQTGEPHWSEPYYDESGGRTMVVTYSQPLHDASGRTVGVFAADISLAWLTELIVGIQLYADSYSTLTSREGRLMASPAETLDVAKVRRYDTLLDGTGWKMSIVIPEDEIYHDIKKIRLIMTILMLLGLGLLILIIWRTAHQVMKLREVSESKQKMEHDLQIASAIQMAMLPKTFPTYPERTDLDVFALLTPAREVGGDLYDFFIRDGRLFFCIGDVSGKGIPASLVMAVTRSLFRSTSVNDSHPGRIVSHINNAISDGNETDMFVTFLMGILDLESGILRYCNAGHNAPLVLTEGDARPLAVDANIPLGVLPGFRYTMQDAVIPKGGSLLLFTDGLTEAENADKELYGEDRLEETCRWLATQSAREQIESITEDIHHHVQDAPQSDDLTMLSIKFLGSTDQEAERHLLLQNDIRQIPQLAGFVEDIADECQLSQATAFSLNLALEEAVANMILYARPEEKEGLVEIEAVIRQDRLDFTIKGCGHPFDPVSLEEVDLTGSQEERVLNGLGMKLVRGIMDEVSYEHTGGVNLLHLTKRLG